MDIEVGKSGYVFVLYGKGENRGAYIISLKGQRDGENIYNAKDSDGNLFIQQIVEKALTQGDDEISFQYYPWRNEGDTEARMKIAAISYYEPWDWVIGASAYMDEFTQTERTVSGALASLVTIIVITSIIILAIMAVVAVITGNRIGNPIRKVAEIAKEVARGNLNADNEVLKRKDEVGQLLRGDAGNGGRFACQIRSR